MVNIKQGERGSFMTSSSAMLVSDQVCVELNGVPAIVMRKSDGYMDATIMCQACDKRVNDFIRVQSTKEFLAVSGICNNVLLAASCSRNECFCNACFQKSLCRVPAVPLMEITSLSKNTLPSRCQCGSTDGGLRR